MRFDYRQYGIQPFPGQPEPGIIFRPVIPFRIIGMSAQTSYGGLVDTGADMIVLPSNIAELVGVTMLSPNSFAALGAGGEFEISYGKVLLEIGSGKNSHRWCAIVGITKQPWEEAVLGHVGFLEYFDITFLGEARAVRLKKNKLAFSSMSFTK